MAATYPLPPPGTLIDIGGYRLHYVLQGAEHPGPMVILERGIGGDHLHWFAVQPDVATFAPVLSYDRAGLGWSDPSPHDRSSEQIARELHALLTQIGIAGPYILVGNSIGGVHVRHFAHQHPDMVCGIVLVDSTHVQQDSRLPPDIREIFAPLRAEEKAKIKHRSTLTHPEITAYYTETDPQFFGADSPFPPDVLEQVLDRMRPGAQATLLREIQALEAAFEGAQPPAPLGDLPMVVLTATKTVSPLPMLDDAQNAVRKQLRATLQAELAALSTQSTHIEVECGHLIQLEQPAAIVDAIRSLVDCVRRA